MAVGMGASRNASIIQTGYGGKSVARGEDQPPRNLTLLEAMVGARHFRKRHHVGHPGADDAARHQAQSLVQLRL